MTQILELFNTENIWGVNNSFLYKVRGNAKNICGNVSGLSGDVTELSGCYSRIIGPTDRIKEFTYNGDDLQYLIKKYSLSCIAFCKNVSDGTTMNCVVKFQITDNSYYNKPIENNIDVKNKLKYLTNAIIKKRHELSIK